MFRRWVSHKHKLLLVSQIEVLIQQVGYVGVKVIPTHPPWEWMPLMAQPWPTLLDKGTRFAAVAVRPSRGGIVCCEGCLTSSQLTNTRSSNSCWLANRGHPTTQPSPPPAAVEAPLEMCQAGVHIQTKLSEPSLQAMTLAKTKPSYETAVRVELQSPNLPHITPPELVHPPGSKIANRVTRQVAVGRVPRIPTMVMEGYSTHNELYSQNV